MFTRCVEAITINQNDSALQFNVRLDGNWVTMLVDTGAAVSIIPRQLYETALSHRPLLPTTVNLRAYGGSQLVVTGVITASVETEDGRSCQGRLYVVDGGTPLLGRDLQKSLCISTWHGSAVYEVDRQPGRSSDVEAGSDQDSATQSTVQATTGRSPAELLHGRPMRGKLSAALDVGGRHPARPVDLHEHVKRKQTYQKTYFDRSHGVKTPNFSVGDQVRHRLLPQARKGQLRFSATKRIVEQRGPASYLLDDGTRVHADRLTRSAGSCPAEVDGRRGEPVQPDGAADRTGPTDAELESSGGRDRLEQQEQDRLEAIPEPETTDSHLRLDGRQLDVPPAPLEADETTSGRSAIRPSRARVLLAATTVVPARSVIVVRASVVPVNGKVSNPCALQGVIEPSHTAQREDLLIPREVVTVDDVVAIQEAQFPTKTTVRIPGYQPPVVTRRTRGRQTGAASAKGGDVAIYVRGGLTFSTLSDSYQAPADDTTEICGVRIHGKFQTDIINVYRPPIRRTRDDDRTDNFDPGALPSGDNTIILGDFNGHHPSWDYECDAADEVGNRLAEWLDREDWLPLNTGEPTHTSYRSGCNTAPDVACCSRTLARRTSWSVGPDLGSDHLPMLLTVRSTPAAQRTRKKAKWAFQKADWVAFRADCEDALCRAVPQRATAQELTTRFTEAVMSASRRHIPRGARPDAKPWVLDPELQQAVSDRQEARRQIRADDPASKERWIAAKRRAADVERSATQTHFRTFVEDNLNQPASLGRVTKILKKWEGAGDEHQPGQAMRVGGRLLVTDREKAQAFCATYAHVSRQVRSAKEMALVSLRLGAGFALR
ncbi:hypothetical protein FJT64_004848 [Amphibalanus amphitrite]|uniref:Peptidase A2 domain-containing protein n=1 Tax=Amphibalanus amphitrite TaxID=1232801 RepID=A0A6A4VSA6_AMPAM|nr:hypothetical protein FJT64_004848 [Amphibalanus amphitrite]